MKNNKFVKFLSTILVAILIVTIAPVNDAVASEMKTSANGIIKNIGEAVENIDFKGFNITPKATAAKAECTYYWKWSTQTLVIGGRGKMPSYNKDKVPWREYSNAKKVIISGELTSLSMNAFHSFTQLETVEIEAPITQIGGVAFYNCTSLKSITLPDTLQSIGAYAFENCVSLKEFTIPDSVTNVSMGILSGCNIEKLTTPFVGGGPDNENSNKSNQLGYMFGLDEKDNTYTVKSRNDSKKKYYVPYSLKSVTVTQGLYKYGFENSIGIEEVIIARSVKSESIPACYVYGCTNLKNFEINTSRISTIGMYAFSYCEALESIVLPENMKRIMAYSFMNCTKLGDVQFPNRDIAIERYSFKNTKLINDNTEEFLIVGDGVLIGYKGTAEKVQVPYGVKRIGGAFNDRTDIVEVSLPDSLLYLSDSSFFGCTSIEHLVVPDSVQTIDAGAFSGMCNLRTLSVPFTGKSRNAEGLTTEPLFGCAFGTDSKCPVCNNTICVADTQTYIIRNSWNYYEDSYTYNFPRNLYTVTVTDNRIPSYAFRDSNVKRVVLGDGVTGVGPYSFYHSSLQEIVFNEVITSLPEQVFTKCSKLKTVTLTSSIKSINGTFEGCTSLVTVNFAEGLETIGASSFFGCEWLREFDLPDSLKTIGSGAFGNCKAIKEFHFGEGLQEISSSAFIDDRDDYKSIEAFYVDEDNPYLYSSDGVVYSQDGVLVAYPECKKASSFYINERVTKIRLDTFDQMDVTEEFIVHPDNKHFTAIDGILYNKDVTRVIRCPREKTGEYVSPETVVDVESMAFFRCIHLDKIEFINDDVEFEPGAFQAVDVPEFIVPNLENEMAYYFRNPSYKGDLGWAAINILKITNQRQSIDPYFTKYVGQLRTVEINGDYHTIGEYAFSGCGFEEFTIPDSVKWIGEYAFDQSNIKRVYGGNNIRVIGRSAFANTDLEYFQMPEALEKLGSYAFAGVHLTEVVFHDKLVEVGSRVFNYSKIKRAVINEAIKHLSDELFVNCFELETVVVGGAVESIGVEAFGKCNALEAVIIPSNVTEISDDAFLEANEDVVIYCNEGSYAEEYAVKNNIKYTTLVIDPIENQVYTGKEIKPDVKASANNRRLTKDTEFTVSYKDNIDAGTAKVIAKGLGDFKHLAATAQFTILPKSSENMRVISGSSTYSPEGVDPLLYVYCGIDLLVEGKDYEIVENALITDAGEYNIAISFKGNYYGIINTTYKVSKRSITRTEIEYGDTVKITCQGVTLEEGKDYIVTKETKENGDVVTIVEGIGNYKGKASRTEKGDDQMSFGWFQSIIDAIKSMFDKLFNIGI